jgi:hypothetical protein
MIVVLYTTLYVINSILMKLKELKTCRICLTKKLIKYLNLGSHPYSNSFLRKNQIFKETKYPLELQLCKKCGLSQLSVILHLTF